MSADPKPETFQAMRSLDLASWIHHDLDHGSSIVMRSNDEAAALAATEADRLAAEAVRRQFSQEYVSSLHASLQEAERRLVEAERAVRDIEQHHAALIEAERERCLALVRLVQSGEISLPGAIYRMERPDA